MFPRNPGIPLNVLAMKCAKSIVPFNPLLLFLLFCLLFPGNPIWGKYWYVCPGVLRHLYFNNRVEYRKDKNPSCWYVSLCRSSSVKCIVQSIYWRPLRPFKFTMGYTYFPDFTVSIILMFSSKRGEQYFQIWCYIWKGGILSSFNFVYLKTFPNLFWLQLIWISF